MFPELFRIGPVTFYTYGLTLVLAVAGAGWYFARAAGRAGIAGGSIRNIILGGVLGGVMGARLLFVFANWREFAGQPQAVCFLPAGGLVFQGAILGGALAVWAIVTYERLSATAVMDAAAPAIAIGAAIGRIGCLANGCCAGVPAAPPLGWAFPGYSSPRLPIQLADIAYNGAIAAGLAWLATRPHRRGDLLWLWAVAYGVARFSVESWRAIPAGVDPGTLAAYGLNPRVFLGFTLPQLYALAMGAGGAVMLARGRLWGERAGPGSEPGGQVGPGGDSPRRAGATGGGHE